MEEAKSVQALSLVVLPVGFRVSAFAQAGEPVPEHCIARYNWPGHDCDRASAAAVDSLGNVCVTGEGVICNSVRRMILDLSFDTAGLRGPVWGVYLGKSP